MTQLENTGITTRTLRIPRRDLLEELRHDLTIVDLTAHLTARMEISALGFRYQRLRKGAELLRLRRRRLYPPMTDEGHGHINVHRLPMFRCELQLAALLKLTPTIINV